MTVHIQRFKLINKKHLRSVIHLSLINTCSKCHTTNNFKNRHNLVFMIFTEFSITFLYYLHEGFFPLVNIFKIVVIHNIFINVHVYQYKEINIKSINTYLIFNQLR